ncbi:hypothetical protein Mapa_006796 [Marchantia paleacea]|nr:hypothetical protein Mapa_006796 [Marchantia paleacea]
MGDYTTHDNHCTMIKKTDFLPALCCFDSLKVETRFSGRLQRVRIFLMRLSILINDYRARQFNLQCSGNHASHRTASMIYS